MAAIFGVALGTVSEILKRHGVRRNQGLTEDQVEQAISRYEAGESLAKIGRTLGVAADTVRAQLLKRGMQTRDPHGRQRTACA